MENLKQNYYWIDRHLSTVAEEIYWKDRMKELIESLGVNPDDMRELEISAGEGKRYIGAFYSANLTEWTKEQLQSLENFLRANRFKWDIYDNAMTLMEDM